MEARRASFLRCGAWLPPEEDLVAVENVIHLEKQRQEAVIALEEKQRQEAVIALEEKQRQEAAKALEEKQRQEAAKALEEKQRQEAAKALEEKQRQEAMKLEEQRLLNLAIARAAAEQLLQEKRKVEEAALQLQKTLEQWSTTFCVGRWVQVTKVNPAPRHSFASASKPAACAAGTALQQVCRRSPETL
jgi:Mg/Co/Ni transporter MgtE